MIGDYLQADSPERNRMGIFPSFEVWGTVLAANEATKEGSIRVMVKTMQDGMDTLDDVPVLGAYGGKDHGFYFLPEEGDVVKVTFLGGDFGHPVVTGCRMPAESGFVREQYQKENTKKALKLQNGSCILFSGEQGKGKIQVSGSEKMDWELDEDKEQISFGDKEQKNRISLEKKDGRTVIKAEEEIRLECGKSSLSLKKDGTVVLHCEKLALEAANVAVKAKNKVQAEGQNLILQASMDMGIKSKGQLKVESKGSMKLSAAVINLN